MSEAPILAALFPRGISGFLGIAIPVALCVVAFCLRRIGTVSWLRAGVGSFVGFLCYPLAIGLLIWAFSSEKYGELLGWSMMFGLPFIIGIGLLLVAWLVNVAILCGFGGMKAGAITGFLVLPAMWTLCFGSGISLLDVYEEKRESLDPADAVARGDYDFIRKETNAANANVMLEYALRYIDSSAAEIALVAGANVNGVLKLVNDIPQTPLQIALEPLTQEANALEPKLKAQRQRDLVALLLRQKAVVNFVGPGGTPPLTLAAQNGCEVSIIKALLDAGAQVSKEQPPLHAAAILRAPLGPEMVTLLLEAGAELHAPRPADNWTPLQCAAAAGNTEVLQLLIERGASVNLTTMGKPDEAPLLLAARYDHPATALVLLDHGADPMLRTSEGLSAWQLNRDAALRQALEAKGVPREVHLADYSMEEGNTAEWLFKAFTHNTSVYRVQGALADKLTGAGPWDMKVRFPEDAAPVLLKGVAHIRCEELASDISGGGRIVKQTVTLGTKLPPENTLRRKMEKLEPFSTQVQLGYAVTFFFAEQEPTAP